MSVGQAFRDIVEARLRDFWKRSALPSLTIPDPGHGLDEISPIVEHGRAFDPTRDADSAPFLARHLSGWSDGDEIRPGTGYLVWMLRYLRDEEIYPGAIPEIVAAYSLDFQIKTPARLGGDLAALYTGALNLIFRQWSVRRFDVDIVEVADSQAPADLPRYEGQDKTWRYDQHSIPLTLHYRARPA